MEPKVVICQKRAKSTAQPIRRSSFARATSLEHSNLVPNQRINDNPDSEESGPCISFKAACLRPRDTISRCRVGAGPEHWDRHDEKSTNSHIATK
jgi:hypothetical protein